MAHGGLACLTYGVRPVCASVEGGLGVRVTVAGAADGPNQQAITARSQGSLRLVVRTDRVSGVDILPAMNGQDSHCYPEATVEVRAPPTEPGLPRLHALRRHALRGSLLVATQCRGLVVAGQS